MPEAPARTRTKIQYPTVLEFTMMVYQGLIHRDGAAALSESRLQSLHANIGKGYQSACEAIRRVHEEIDG